MLTANMQPDKRGYLGTRVVSGTPRFSQERKTFQPKPIKSLEKNPGPNRDLNPGPPTHMAGVLTTRPLGLVARVLTRPGSCTSC